MCLELQVYTVWQKLSLFYCIRIDKFYKYTLKTFLFNSLKTVTYVLMNHNTQKRQELPNNHSEYISLMVHLRPWIWVQPWYKPTSAFSESVHLPPPCVYQTISLVLSAARSSHSCSHTNWSAWEKKKAHEEIILIP